MDGDRLPEETAPAGAGAVTGQPIMLLSQRFTAETVTAVRHALTARVAAAGLVGDACDDFVLAVHELVANAVRHGGGSGQLDLRRHDDALICEVTDYGPGADSLPTEPPAANVPGGRGLWLAHQLAGELRVTHRHDGITATVSGRFTPQEPTPRADSSCPPPRKGNTDPPQAGGR